MTPPTVTQQQHFRDRRPPHEVQFALERDLMTLFAVAMENERLTMRAKTKLGSAPCALTLRFEAAQLLTNCYSLCVETPEGTPSVESWFGFWTRDFKPAAPPEAETAPTERYQKLCAAALHAEAHLDTVAALQQAIVAAMKQGASFATSHKEGGTTIRWRGGRFMCSDYGESSAQQAFASEEEFLKYLRQFYDWQTSQSTYPDKLSDFDVWKLILRLLRN